MSFQPVIIAIVRVEPDADSVYAATGGHDRLLRRILEHARRRVDGDEVDWEGAAETAWAEAESYTQIVARAAASRETEEALELWLSSDGILRLRARRPLCPAHQLYFMGLGRIERRGRARHLVFRCAAERALVEAEFAQ